MMPILHLLSLNNLFAAKLTLHFLITFSVSHPSSRIYKPL